MLKSRDTIYVGLLCLLIVTLLTSYYSTIPIILLLLFFLCEKKSNIKIKVINAFQNPMTTILSLYFLVHLIAFLFSMNNNYALREMTQRLSYLILPIILLGEKIEFKKLRNVLLCLSKVTTVILISLVLYHVVFYQKNISSFAYFGYKVLNISPFYYSVFIFIAMKISLELKPKYWYIELAILFLCLFLLGNRTSIVFILIYMFYLFFREVKFSLLKRVGAMFLLLLSVGVTLFFSNSFRQKTNVLLKTISFDIETIKTKNSITITRNTFEHRILIWYLAKDIIKENLIFGAGTSNYKSLLFEKYENINFKAAIKDKFNTHNQYIEEMLKFGLIGGVVFILMIIGLIKQVSNMEIVLPILLLVLVLSFFESFWYRHHGVLIISFIIPLLYVYSEQKKIQ